MIERVANAIYAAFQAPGLTGEPQTIATLSPNYAEMYRKQARAAIAAMREPAPSMVEAMVHDHDVQGIVYLCGPGAWKAGIDAILNEK